MLDRGIPRASLHHLGMAAVIATLAHGLSLADDLAPAIGMPAAVRIAPDRVWVASYTTNELVGLPR